TRSAPCGTGAGRPRARRVSSRSRGSKRPRGTTRTRARPPAAAAESHFRFFGGKGGVGKTTCAASAALVEADAGGRVRLMPTDPAHSRGAVFAGRLGPRPRRIAATAGTLDVVELDADRALAGWIGERRLALRRVVGRGTYLDDEDIESLLRLAFPGVD